jgi:hypothetical protein
MIPSLGAVAVLLACLSQASAANISVFRNPAPQPSMILILGEIQRGDAERFFEATEGVQRGLVALGSPGGSVIDALRIGTEIRRRNYATTVAPNCVSACGLIWLAGARRYLNEGAKVGFHAAYVVRDGVPHETGMGNAEIGSFLTHLGLRIEANPLYHGSFTPRGPLADFR